jgi:hypothetical protein
MKRNIDLVKQILIQVEALDQAVLNLKVEGFDQSVVNEHILLCIQAGLLNGTVDEDSLGRAADSVVKRLSWNGHEFLQLARNTPLWNKAKSTFKDKAVSFSVEMFFAYLKQEAIHYLPQ